MKIFPSDGGHPLLPRAWLDAVGAPAHIQQGEVVAVAESRRQLAEMLAAVRAPLVADSLRLRRGEQNNSAQALIDAGVIALDEPGIYVYERAVKDAPVIRVTPDGCTVVAHFRMERFSAPMTVEPAKP